MIQFHRRPFASRKSNDTRPLNGVYVSLFTLGALCTRDDNNPNQMGHDLFPPDFRLGFLSLLPPRWPQTAAGCRADAPPASTCRGPGGREQLYRQRRRAPVTTMSTSRAPAFGTDQPLAPIENG